MPAPRPRPKAKPKRTQRKSTHPPHPNRRPKLLEQVRKIVFALPEGTEKEAWGAPTFRVREKMFAMYNDDHHGDGRIALWCKAPPGVQEILVGAAPQRFFRPPYVGHKGWLGVYLDEDVDWEEIESLLKDAYRLTAPKKLA